MSHTMWKALQCSPASAINLAYEMIPISPIHMATGTKDTC